MQDKNQDKNQAHDDDLNNADYVKQVLTCMNATCSSYSHENCKKVQNLILQNIQNGRIFPSNVLDSYVRFLVKPTTLGYYSRPDCCRHGENYLQALSALIAFNCPLNTSLIAFVDNNMVEMIQSVVNNGYDIPQSLLSHAITSEKETIANILSKYDKLEVTADHLNKASLKHMHDTVLNILTRKISPTKEAIICTIESGNTSLVKTMLNLGTVNLDSSFLMAACQAHSEDLIAMFLDIKILPTKECFNKLINNNTKDADIYNYNRRRRIYGRNEQKQEKETSALIDLLIKYGYKPDYADVTNATRKKIKINNIEMFDIKFDEKFLEVCAEQNFYPYKLHNINPTAKCLEKACTKSGNLPAIKDLVIKQGLKPTSECMRAACKHKSNIQTIKLLVQHGGKPDFKCIENIADTIRNRTLSYVIDEYKKHAKITEVNYVEEDDSDKDDSDKDDSVKDDVKDVADKNAYKDPDKDSDEEDPDKDPDEDPDEEETDKNSPKKDAIKRVRKDSDEDSDKDGDKDDDNDSDDEDIENVDDKKNISVNQQLKSIADKKNFEKIKEISDEEIEQIEQIEQINNDEVKDIEVYIRGPKKGMPKPSKKILVKGKGRKTTQPIKELKSEEESDNEQNTSSSSIRVPVEDKIDIISIDKPAKVLKLKDIYNLNDNLSLLLTKKKSSKMTFLEVKQKLLHYVKNNNLFDEKNKLLIKITPEVHKISGLKVNTFMNFIEFDNFVSSCILKQ